LLWGQFSLVFFFPLDRCALAVGSAAAVPSKSSPTADATGSSPFAATPTADATSVSSTPTADWSRASASAAMLRQKAGPSKKLMHAGKRVNSLSKMIIVISLGEYRPECFRRCYI
jgi:hypothetical protein